MSEIKVDLVSKENAALAAYVDVLTARNSSIGKDGLSATQRRQHFTEHLRQQGIAFTTRPDNEDFVSLQVIVHSLSDPTFRVSVAFSPNCGMGRDIIAETLFNSVIARWTTMDDLLAFVDRTCRGV